MMRRALLAAAAVAALPATGREDALVQRAAARDWQGLVSAVRARVRYRPRNGAAVRTPAQVWAIREGDCAEVALLMMSAITEAGRDARYLWCRVHGVIAHVIVVADGLALDPTEIAEVLPLERRHDLTHRTWVSGVW